MQTATVALWFVPASVTCSQTYPDRQSGVSAQLTRHTQPVSSSPQEEPDGHWPELPQDTVHVPSGNRELSWQRR
jgi:hypothetical protein